MTTDNFCFDLQMRLIQTSQTGGQQYSDTSPFSIHWSVSQSACVIIILIGPRVHDESGAPVGKLLC